jgi:hypothetical protein
MVFVHVCMSTHACFLACSPHTLESSPCTCVHHVVRSSADKSGKTERRPNVKRPIYTKARNPDRQRTSREFASPPTTTDSFYATFSQSLPQKAHTLARVTPKQHEQMAGGTLTTAGAHCRLWSAFWSASIPVWPGPI